MRIPVPMISIENESLINLIPFWKKNIRYGGCDDNGGGISGFSLIFQTLSSSDFATVSSCTMVAWRLISSKRICWFWDEFSSRVDYLSSWGPRLRFSIESSLFPRSAWIWKVVSFASFFSDTDCKIWGVLGITCSLLIRPVYEFQRLFSTQKL